MDFPVSKRIDIDIRDRVLTQDFKYKLPIGDGKGWWNGKMLHIKKGFTWDGASIPAVFWSVIGSPFSGRYAVAAIAHDALYCSEWIARSDADWIFLEIMEACGCWWITRNIIYSAVRIGGGIIWSNHKREDVKEARRLITLQWR